MSAEFYSLLDSDADKDSLKVEFATTIVQNLLQLGGSIAKKTRKVLSEMLAGKGSKR